MYMHASDANCDKNDNTHPLCAILVVFGDDDQHERALAAVWLHLPIVVRDVQVTGLYHAEMAHVHGVKPQHAVLAASHSIHLDLRDACSCPILFDAVPPTHLQLRGRVRLRVRD